MFEQSLLLLPQQPCGAAGCCCFSTASAWRLSVVAINTPMSLSLLWVHLLGLVPRACVGRVFDSVAQRSIPSMAPSAASVAAGVIHAVAPLFTGAHDGRQSASPSTMRLTMARPTGT